MAVALVAAAAAASPAAASPSGRAGLTFGFDAGVGEMSPECSDTCTGSLDHSGTAALHVGGMLSPGRALLYDAWLLVHLADSAFGNVLVAHSLHTAALQGWVTPRLWLRGGVGLAHMRIRFGDVGTRTDTVPALAAAAGYEALQRGRMILDVTLRMGAGFYDEDEAQDETVYNIALGAGLSWY